GNYSGFIDYVLVLVDSSESGQKTADHLAERLGDAPPPFGHLGVVLCRAEASTLEALPEQTNERGLPILGMFPADYLLAGDESDQRHCGKSMIPHESYLNAVQRLSRALIRLAGLRRVPTLSQDIGKG